MSTSESKTEDKPLILTVDDDEEINILLRTWLKDVHCKLISYTNPKEFLLQFKTLNPRLCIVDINIGAPGVGFKIVEAVRKVLGKKPPIILFSSDTDTKGIAHGVDLGADDYLIKPSSKSVLVEKVESYINVIPWDQKDLKKSIPEEYRQIKVLIDVTVEEMDEFGIKIRGNELLAKGSAVLLKSEFLSKFSGNEKSVLGTVVSNWIHAEDRTAGAFIEFDQTNEVFLTQVRAWIIKNQQIKAA